MRKLLALSISLLLLLSLGACTEEEPSFDPKYAITAQLRTDVALYSLFTYGYPNTDPQITHMDFSGDNIYVVKGKLTITDDYGDQYVGKFDAVYKVNPTAKTAEQIEFTLETPTKVD